MTDNTIQTGADTISTDDLGGGIKVQRVKAQYGPDGTATDVSLTTPLPTFAQAAAGYWDENGNKLSLLRAFANIAAGQTAANVIAATVAKKIRVLQLAIVCGSVATNITLNSATTAMSPLFANDAFGGEVLPFSPMGWFETNAGDALTVTTSAGATTGIQIGYVLV